MSRADALVVVSPEYNHGYSGLLKHALDSCLKEYVHKAAGVVGVSAGRTAARAASRTCSPCCGSSAWSRSSGTSTSPPCRASSTRPGRCAIRPNLPQSDKFLKELVWMARTLRHGREHVALHGGEVDVPEDRDQAELPQHGEQVLDAARAAVRPCGHADDARGFVNVLLQAAVERVSAGPSTRGCTRARHDQGVGAAHLRGEGGVLDRLAGVGRCGGECARGRSVRSRSPGGGRARTRGASRPGGSCVPGAPCRGGRGRRAHARARSRGRAPGGNHGRDEGAASDADRRAEGADEAERHREARDVCGEPDQRRPARSPR